jgi:hypothetical protein
MSAFNLKRMYFVFDSTPLLSFLKPLNDKKAFRFTLTMSFWRKKSFLQLKNHNFADFPLNVKKTANTLKRMCVKRRKTIQ